MLRCLDNSLYCGITKNLERRLKEHNSNSSRGAKYLRSKKPAVLVYKEEYPDLKTALKREIEVKKLSKLNKEALVRAHI